MDSLKCHRMIGGPVAGWQLPFCARMRKLPPMATEELYVSESWRPALGRAGLDSLEALLGFEGGQTVGWHKRSQTFRLDLEGRTVFLKRDMLTLRKQILLDLLRLRPTLPMTYKERLAMVRAAGAGVRTAEIIAWGQARRRGLAHRGLLVTAELAGRPLDKLLGEAGGEAERGRAMRAAGAAVGKLYAAGLSWPDLLPRHVHVVEGGDAGLLDLERLTVASGGRLARDRARQIERFIEECRKAGAGEDDLAALREGLGL